MTNRISSKSVHVFKLVMSCNRSAHGQCLRIMDDIAPPWMEANGEFQPPFCSRISSRLICDCLKTTRIFTLTSYNVCASTLILKQCSERFWGIIG
jgi:hypothetical protein